MSFTHYQSKFIAHYLTLEGAPEESIPRALAGARVDMNPHQVEAALFAIGSPLSKGAILADEVGLRKTIEASLVLAQRWAERKRRLLLIVPATLRKQWAQELADKFHLRSRIIEAKAFNADRKAGHANPFDRSDAIIIASYQFAAQKRAEVAAVPWDLVVFDEAHKLRNVWRKDGVSAVSRDLLWGRTSCATSGARTATRPPRRSPTRCATGKRCFSPPRPCRTA